MSIVPSAKCHMCVVVKTALSLIFTVVMVAALLGAYEAHTTPGGLTFGSIEASVSILAVVLTLMYWTKHTDASGILHPRYQQTMVLIILIVATVTAIVDFFMAHFGGGMLIVGTMESLFSIVAFAVCAKHWAKHLQWVCQECRI